MTESNNCDRKDILSKKIVSVTHRSFCDRNKQVSVTERSFCHRKKILSQTRFTVTDRSFCDRKEFVMIYVGQGLLLPDLKTCELHGPVKGRVFYTQDPAAVEMVLKSFNTGYLTHMFS